VAIAGIAQVLRLTGERDVKGKVFRLLSGLLYLGGGIWVLAFPIESEVSLTLFVGFLLAFEGVMELAAAATSKARPGAWCCSMASSPPCWAAC
jgi:membrane protein HdeD